MTWKIILIFRYKIIPLQLLLQLIDNIRSNIILNVLMFTANYFNTMKFLSQIFLFLESLIFLHRYRL